MVLQRTRGSKSSAGKKLKALVKAACGRGQASGGTGHTKLFWIKECRVGPPEKLESGSRLAVRAEEAASRPA